MSFGQFREIRLRDFRCFQDRQAVRLAPLTLLVGENSTGKTSFLAAIQAVWDAAYGSGVPDFRKAPFDLGAFPEIVHSRGGHAITPGSFAIGFTEQFLDDRLFDFEVTFESRDAAPAPAATEWREGAMLVAHLRAQGEDARYVFESPNGSWSYFVSKDDQMFEWPRVSGFFSRLIRAVAEDDPMSLVDDLRFIAGDPRPTAEFGRPRQILVPDESVRAIRVARAAVCERTDTPGPPENLRPNEAVLGPMGCRRSLPLCEPSVSGQGRVGGAQGKAGCVRPRVGTVRRLHGEAAHRSRGRAVPAPGAKVRQAWTEGTQTQSDRRGIRGQPSAAGARSAVSCGRTADVSSATTRVASASERPGGAGEPASAGRRKRGGSSSWKHTASTSSIVFAWIFVTGRQR